MAEEAKGSFFRKSALNSITNANDLDIFLKVSNPGAWISVVAFLAFIVGLFVWAFTAEVPVRETTKALVDPGGTVRCWVDADLAQKLGTAGARVAIGGAEATGVVVQPRPMSSGEIRDVVGGSYIADELGLGEWNYEVNLTFSEVPYGGGPKTPFLAPVEVVYAMEHPIELVFGG